MTLSSSSTLTNALDQYNDNLSWEGDVAKAILALEALRYLRVNRPQATGRESVQISYIDLETEIAELKTFVTSNRSGASPRARVADVTGRS